MVRRATPTNANSTILNCTLTSAAPYQSIFSYDTPALLYGNNVAPANSILETNATLNALFLGVNLLPVASDKFRAEFVQYGVAQCCLNHPKQILELDGYDSYLTQASIPHTPVPAALPLFATGLGALALLGWRREDASSRLIIFVCGRETLGRKLGGFL